MQGWNYFLKLMILWSYQLSYIIINYLIFSLLLFIKHRYVVMMTYAPVYIVILYQLVPLYYWFIINQGADIRWFIPRCVFTIGLIIIYYYRFGCIGWFGSVPLGLRHMVCCRPSTGSTLYYYPRIDHRSYPGRGYC